MASRFDAGATIVFGQLHRRVPALARLCVAIGQIFGCRVQTNTFVLQVAGTKSWSVYDTKVTLPLKGQRFDPEQHEPGPVSGQFELGPGDVAFLSARVASAR